MIANDVQKLINDNMPVDDATGVDIRTYIYNVPDNVRNDNKITVLITDLPSKPSVYGSNNFLETDYHISIQIYYPYGYAKDFDLVSDKIIDLLESNGWYFITNHILSDPETDRQFMMADFHKYYRRKKEF